MQKVNMHEAKVYLSQYVELAAAGEEILNVCEWIYCPPSCPASRAIATKVLGTGKGTFQDSWSIWYSPSRLDWTNVPNKNLMSPRFFLLDTRIFLEALLNSDQLPVVIQIELMNPTNTIGFSVASIWEIVSSLLWTVRTSVQLNRNPSTSSGANFYWVTQQYFSLAVRQRDSVHLRFSCWIGYSCKATSQRTVIIRNKL